MACTRMHWNLPTSVQSVPYQAVEPNTVVPLSNQSQCRDPSRSGVLTSWNCLSPRRAMVNSARLVHEVALSLSNT